MDLIYNKPTKLTNNPHSNINPGDDFPDDDDFGISDNEEGLVHDQ